MAPSIVVQIVLKYALLTLQVLMEAKNPVIIVGTNALNRADGSSLHGLCATISNSLKAKGNIDPEWRVLNVLQRVYSITLPFSRIL